MAFKNVLYWDIELYLRMLILQFKLKWNWNNNLKFISIHAILFILQTLERNKTRSRLNVTYTFMQHVHVIAYNPVLCHYLWKKLIIFKTSFDKRKTKSENNTRTRMTLRNGFLDFIYFLTPLRTIDVIWNLFFEILITNSMSTNI